MKTVISGLSIQERKILSNITAREQAVVGMDDVIAILDCPKATANKILSRLTKKGWLQRVRRGQYVVVPLASQTAQPAIEEIWPVAMKVFDPAFISGWSAAEYWDLTEQIFNSISLVTTRPQRNHTQIINNTAFRTRVLGKDKFFGTKTIWFGSNKVQIADPNRLVIDILDMPRFGGGARHVLDVMQNFWKSALHDADLLLEYVDKYDRGVVVKRLGFIAEMGNAPVTPLWLDSLQKKVKSGVVLLDPDGPKTGKIVSKWNVRVNIPLTT